MLLTLGEGAAMRYDMLPFACTECHSSTLAYTSSSASVYHRPRNIT